MSGRRLLESLLNNEYAVEEAKLIFCEIDQNKDGIISPYELYEACDDIKDNIVQMEDYISALLPLGFISR